MVGMISKDYTTGYCVFVVDTASELDKLPTMTSSGKDDLRFLSSCSFGSHAIVTETYDIYILNGNENKWIKVSTWSDESGTPVAEAVLMTDAAPQSLSVVGTTTLNGIDYWQEDNNDAKTTTTITATPQKTCLLVAAVMYRGEVSIEGDGWTQATVSETAVDGDINQRITVWTKPVEAGIYDVTINQIESARMSLKVVAIYNATAVTVIDNTVIETFPFTPTPVAHKRRLYLISSIYANDSISNTIVAEKGVNTEMIERRFCVFWSYETETTPTFAFNLSEYSSNTANIITLDIEEV